MSSAFSVPRRLILSAGASPRLRSFAMTSPAMRRLVGRYIAGETAQQAATTAQQLQARGLAVSLDLLGEDVDDARTADMNTKAYIELVELVKALGMSGMDLSVKPSSVGLRIAGELAHENLARVAAASATNGVTMTLDMEGSDVTDATMDLLRQLRPKYPATGIVVQAMLRRTERDCADLAAQGGRVRLCKGAYMEPAEIAYQQRDEVRASYLRCLELLIGGQSYPMVATHDPLLISGAAARARDRRADEWEYQMLFGVRPEAQAALVNAGHALRVYVPFGSSWYSYFMRRLAERPQNLALFARSLLSRA